MKKCALGLQIIGLLLYACFAYAEPAQVGKVVFLIANKDKAEAVKYNLIDPIGVSHKGSLFTRTDLYERYVDSNTLNFGSADESAAGIYMLHYRVTDPFWGTTLYSNDVVISVTKTTTQVLISISKTGAEIFISALDPAVPEGVTITKFEG